MSEDDERKYIGFAKRKPKYNHIEMKIKIITSLKMEFLKDAAEWRLSREREVHSRYLKQNNIWVRIMDKWNIPFQPALAVIGADPNDDRMEIKNEILRRVNAKGHRVRADKIEVQLKGFQFPRVFSDERRTIGMVIMVSKVGYDRTVEALLEMQREEVRKEEFPTTYDIELEDIRIGGRDMEARLKSAYLSQIQYYLNRV